MNPKFTGHRSPLNRSSLTFFIAALLLLFIVVGVHSGLLIFMQAHAWNEILVVHIVVFYWIAVALALTWFARLQIRKNYELPLRKLSEGFGKVAHGDFSVTILHTHPADRFDYLDDMIEDFNKMTAELGSIETLKTDFVSNVSHEMKTPLAVIKNYSELLQAESLDDRKRQEYASAIETSAGGLTDLISNILRLNRIENQKIVPEAAEFDLCRQLTDCILQFEEKWEEKQLDLDIDMAESAPIVTDESLLALVWNNLLSNAIKFTPAGGRITLSQHTENQHHLVTIRDTGIGMDEATASRIFEKFYQGDSSHHTEGNGLGLALVSRVLTLLHGEISVESQPGQGTAFTVSLPLILK